MQQKLILKIVHTTFFYDMINIKSVDLNKINICKKSYKNILIYYIGYRTVKILSYVAINKVNPLYLIMNKINVYIEVNNGTKYLTLVSTDEIKGILKKYEELQNNIKGLIRSITNNLNNYDKKYMKIKFNSDDGLP